MQLPQGTSLKQYSIVTRIGAGGMGEVYRATDTNLGRDVAIKVLPRDFASDAVRLARFRREARLLASFSHPHVASVHGLDENDGVHFLVMELIEGEDLADRIDRDGAMPPDEVVEIGRQLAEALEAAHERGIVHRDLKPANIRLTGDGAVKVLDFGLAKAFDESAGGAGDAADAATLVRAETASGTILGTAPWMAPEQARGKRVDKRADIWAFGVILFEMLTGRRLFRGETASDTLAAVLSHEVEWESLPLSRGHPLESLIRRCLVRNPAERLRDIGEARIALGRAQHEGVKPAVATVEPSRPMRHGGWRRWLVVPALLGAVAAGWALRPAPERKVVRASLALPAGTLLAFGDGAPPAVAISPDGAMIAFVARRDSASAAEGELYLRPLGAALSTVITGSRGARSPFFSPDGQWLAFFAEGGLKKVPVSGGSPTVLVPIVANAWGGTWLDDGTIVYSNSLPSGEALFSIHASGSNHRLVRRMSKLNEDYSFPYSLGSDEVLITRWRGGLYSDARIDRLNLTTGGEESLIEGGSNTQLTTGSHLVYARGGELFAVRFDRRGHTLDGTPVRVLQGVVADAKYGVPQFALSMSGTLLFAAAEFNESNTLARLGTNGDVQPVVTLSRLDTPRLADDGRTVLYIGGDAERDIWSLDLTTGQRVRLTSAKGENYAPRMSPDRRSVGFIAWREVCEIRRVPAEGGPEEVMLRSPVLLDSISFSADGQWIALSGNPTDSYDIGVIDTALDSQKVKWILNSEYTERDPVFAPVGQRLAYLSDNSGRLDLRVRASVENAKTIVVSRDGGTRPFWSADGTLLYFMSGNRLMVADVTVDGPLAVSPPRLVMETGNYSIFGQTPDGLFLGHLREVPEIRHLEIVINWDEELERAFSR